MKTLKTPPAFVAATIALALSACTHAPKECKPPEEDAKLISAMKQTSVRTNRKTVRKIIERLAANSKERAHDVCRAVNTTSPDRSTELYKARVLSLLDREQQLIETLAVVNKLEKKKEEPTAFCSELWKNATQTVEAGRTDLLTECDANLDKQRHQLVSKLDAFLDKNGMLKDLLEVVRNKDRLEELTIGNIVQHCEKNHPNCSAAFSLARFFRQTDDGKIRFDYERAIVYSMVHAARRADQRFESLLVTGSYSAALIDILARPLFQLLVASFETFVVEKIEKSFGEERGFVTKGGLLRSACAAYETFDLNEAPNSAERTVRSIIFRFHEAKPQDLAKNDNLPVCTPEQAMMEDTKGFAQHARRNLRRVATIAGARKFRSEYAHDPQKADDPWYERALSSRPILLANEIALSRTDDGTLTEAAKKRVDEISACIISKSADCAENGRLDEYASCIAGECGTSYYRYFADTAESGPASRSDECCETCCQDDETVNQVLESKIHSKIEEIRESILKERIKILKSLGSDLKDSQLMSMCSTTLDNQAIIEIDGNNEVTVAKFCDFSRPMAVLQEMTTHIESCHVRKPAKPTASDTVARDAVVKQAQTLHARLAAVKHQVVFTGSNSVRNAHRCHPAMKPGLDWQKQKLPQEGARDMFSVDGYNEALSPALPLELPLWYPKEKDGDCDGRDINRILRHLRAFSLCMKVFEDVKICSDKTIVTIGERAPLHSAEKLCGLLGVKPDPQYEGCEERQIDSCLKNPRNNKSSIEDETRDDRVATVSFMTPEEIEYARQYTQALAELEHIRTELSTSLNFGGSCKD